jgi:putative copper export protein
MQNADVIVTAAESWSFIAVRFTTFTALVIMVGSVLFVSSIVPRLARAGHADLVATMVPRLRMLGLGASIALVALAASRVALQQAVLTQELGGDTPIALRDVLAGSWGAGVALQVAGGIAGALAFGTTLAGLLSALARGVALASAAAPALSGHAAGEESPLVPIIADTIHVGAAGAWVGMLAVLVVVALPTIVQRDRAEITGVLLAAFSPIALVSAALLAVTGGYAGWLHLATLAALWETPYGVVLFRKLALVAFMLAIGALNWRRLGPTVGEPGGVSRLARSSWVELLVALAILFASAVLVARGTPADMLG